MALTRTHHAIRARDGQGLTHAEIGAILGISKSMVQKLEAQALIKLRQILDPTTIAEFEALHHHHRKDRA